MSQRLQEALGFNLSASNFLYALCDYDTLEKKSVSLEEFLEQIKKFDVKILQYRDKKNSNEIQIKNLQILKEKLNIPIIINDKLDLIEYADGLHLGQEDFDLIHKDKKIAVKLLRLKLKDKLLGISTHNEIEILEANSLDVDMIGLGAYKSTNTKDVPNVLGEKISYLAKVSKHPVCAIGGVNINDDIKNIHFNVVGSGLYED